MRGAPRAWIIAAAETCVGLEMVATVSMDIWWSEIICAVTNETVIPTTSHLCGVSDEDLHLALRTALPI